MILKILKIWDERVTFPLRFTYLTKRLLPYLRESKKILDLGSSDGRLAYLLLQRLLSTEIIGIDIHVQQKTYIPITIYDGVHIPFPDNSFDTVMIVDTLHHDLHPESVLAEAKRVARKSILIKDHYWNNWIDFLVLKIGDYIGNRPYGIRLPYNYLKMERWQKIFDDLHVEVQTTEKFRFTMLDPCKQVIFLLKVTL